MQLDDTLLPQASPESEGDNATEPKNPLQEPTIAFESEGIHEPTANQEQATKGNPPLETAGAAAPLKIQSVTDTVRRSSRLLQSQSPAPATGPRRSICVRKKPAWMSEQHWQFLQTAHVEHDCLLQRVSSVIHQHQVTKPYFLEEAHKINVKSIGFSFKFLLDQSC